MPKYYIETYGCQMNVADSEIVTAILQDNGYQEADTIDEAEVIIFNTCSVRQHAEERVLGRISNEMSRKLVNTRLKIGVIGCMAQRLGKRLSTMASGVDFIVGVDNYRKLPELLSEQLKERKIVDAVEQNNGELYSEFIPVRKNEHNAFITIMRGCDNYCSYCIVPHLRGRERSRPLNNILQETEIAGSEGYKDITLLGQNVNSYHWNTTDFPTLLENLNDITSLKRIRFVTSHPKDLSDKLIDTMASCHKVCEHLHLPMQSGDDVILKKMNRGYNFAHYLELINKLRNKIPHIAITTDLIAGFPGETEEQFARTLKAMDRIKFDFAFMFRYSPREGTSAYQLRDEVPEQVKLARLDRMIKFQNVITYEKYRSQIDRTVEVYVEKISKKSSQELSGKTRDFKIVVFPGNKDLIGSFQKVRITDATGWTLKGEIIPTV